MTKAELIAFLEPFTDDIRIVVDAFEFFRDANPTYEVAYGADDTALGLVDGEGYVRL